MPDAMAISIQQESDVVVASIQGMNMAKKAGMSATDSSLCATVVSELATNIVRYAEHGEIRLRVEAEEMHIVASDQGPGIVNVHQAMQEGFSGGSGLGMGLSGIARIMDSIRIDSTLGKGTTVFTSKHLQPKSRHATTNLSATHDDLSMRPYPGESQSGDGGLRMNIGEHRFLALWDVAGHGKEAHQLSQRVEYFIRLKARQEPHHLLQTVHQRFLGTRGLVAAIARVHLPSGRVDYAGAGNIALLHQHRHQLKRLSMQEGVMGYQIRSPKLQHLQLSAGDTLIMHSDGIQTIRQALPINPQSRAEHVSRHIMREHKAEQADDACCLVLRFQPKLRLAKEITACL